MNRVRLFSGVAIASLLAAGNAMRADEPKSEAKPVSPETKQALDQTSLVDQLAREHELLWQKAVAEFKAAAKRIRMAVVKQNFAEARRLVDFAGQAIELNRRYAPTVAAYEEYQQRAKDLKTFVADERRRHDEMMVQKRYEEIQARIRDRIDRLKRTKQQQIETLMDQASALRAEGRFEEAIQVLDQVIGLDPRHDRAKWIRETLDDQHINARDRQAVKERHYQAQDLLVENDEVGVPVHEDLAYPKNWLEISAKRQRAEEERETPATRNARRELEKQAPEIKFDAMAFEEVIENLRTLTGLNIVPNWSALEAAAIERDAEVTMRLTAVKFEKALELILDEVGAGEVDLGFEIDEGVVRISTKDDLSRKTFVKVYDVQDLLVSVPTFRGRTVNVDTIGQQQTQGGLGGGRFLLGTGGGGGGGGSGGGGLFDDSGGDDDDDNTTTQVNPLEPIITLIRSTIDPASWRSAGGNVGSASPLNQQVIVTQTSTAHAQLRDLLRGDTGR